MVRCQIGQRASGLQPRNNEAAAAIGGGFDRNVEREHLVRAMISRVLFTKAAYGVHGAAGTAVSVGCRLSKECGSSAPRKFTFQPREFAGVNVCVKPRT